MPTPKERAEPGNARAQNPGEENGGIDELDLGLFGLGGPDDRAPVVDGLADFEEEEEECECPCGCDSSAGCEDCSRCYDCCDCELLRCEVCDRVDDDEAGSCDLLKRCKCWDCSGPCGRRLRAKHPYCESCDACKERCCDCEGDEDD